MRVSLKKSEEEIKLKKNNTNEREKNRKFSSTLKTCSAGICGLGQFCVCLFFYFFFLFYFVKLFA